MSLRFPRHGRLITLVGPVKSGKTTRLERMLNSAKVIWDNGSGKANKKAKSNIVLAKHPKDDVKSRGKIAGYEAIETEDPDRIAEQIGDRTEAVIISGVNFFEDRRIVTLLRDLVMSNRLVYVAGHNLDWDGNPMNHMPDILSLSDDIEVLEAPCMVSGCRVDATRSQLVDGESQRRCIKHHHFEGRPDHVHDQVGGLELFVGNMFASKTTEWEGKMRKLAAMGIDFEVFRWLKDNRYGEKGKQYKPFDAGFIELNNQERRIPAVLVRDADDIFAYIEGRTGIKELDESARKRNLSHIFVDEVQFFKNIAARVATAVYQGFNFYGTGILRNYQMERWDEVAHLLCLANQIDVMHAYCEVCGREASESQMFVVERGRRREMEYDAMKTAAVGGKDAQKKSKKPQYEYGARCKDDLFVPGMPGPVYNFSKYKPPRDRNEAIAAMGETFK